MPRSDRTAEDRRAGVPARISEATHREMRYVSAMLGLQEGEPVTIRALVDLGWEALKQQRPDIVALLKRAEAAPEDTP
jgi:hypothetical protein